MNRFLSAILVGMTVMASTATQASAQRKTGDDARRVSRRAFEISVDVRLADRRSKCMNAIGSPAFCDCLNGYLPLSVDFQRYITVTSTARTVSGDVQLLPDEDVSRILWKRENGVTSC
jgi:hypothetical protein